MKKNFLCCVAFLTILIFFVSCDRYSLDFICGDSSLTEAEARKIGEIRLKSHCERKGISINEFSEPEITKQENTIWIVDYTTKKNDAEPYHFFRVTIDNCGRVETGWQYYDFRNK